MTPWVVVYIEICNYFMKTSINVYVSCVIHAFTFLIRNVATPPPPPPQLSTPSLNVDTLLIRLIIALNFFGYESRVYWRIIYLHMLLHRHCFYVWFISFFIILYVFKWWTETPYCDKPSWFTILFSLYYLSKLGHILIILEEMYICILLSKCRHCAQLELVHFVILKKMET